MAGHSRKKLDLTGQRFGRLTVLEPAANIGPRTAWRCRCDCGEETTVITQRLRSGRQTSCGCDKEHFGKLPCEIARANLTYIDGTCVEMIRTRPVRSNNTSGVTGVEWVTRKQRWRATIHFKGKRRYLGCYEKFEDAVRARKQAEENVFEPFLAACDGEIPQSELRPIEEACPPLGRDYSDQRLDLTGQRFGMLAALEPAEDIGSMTAWKCRCDCGKELAVMTAHLRSGQTSCGCKPYWNFVDGTFVELIRSKTIRKNNTSGVTGVEWVPAANKWKAVIFFKGKRHYLGCYGDFEDAVKARKRAEEEIFEPFLREFAEKAAQQAADG